VLASIPESWSGRRPTSARTLLLDRRDRRPRGGRGYALETQNRPGLPGAPDTEFLVHELAHQWYGDSVTPGPGGTCGSRGFGHVTAEWLWQEDHDGDTADEIFNSLYQGDYYDDPDLDEASGPSHPPSPPAPRTSPDSPV